MQNSEKKLSTFKSHGFADDYSAYTKLLINQFEAENNYFRVQNDIDTIVSGKITSPIIHNAALDYLTSNKSVSEIYYELQKKYPNEKIFFNDIMNEIKTTIQPVSDKEWSLIGQNEANIHKKQLELQALDLYPPTKNKEEFKAKLVGIEGKKVQNCSLSVRLFRRYLL